MPFLEVIGLREDAGGQLKSIGQALQYPKRFGLMAQNDNQQCPMLEFLGGLRGLTAVAQQ